MLKRYLLQFFALALLLGCNVGFFSNDNVDKCNEQNFVSSNQICENGILKNPCGNGYYDASTQFCYSDVIYEKCKPNKLDNSLEFIYETFDYGGQTYKTIKIGNQTWMAENLNYYNDKIIGKCYENQTSNCDEYGRLYDYETALNICPEGWHLPNKIEWDILVNCTGGRSSLSSTSGWRKPWYNGSDSYGFSAMPGGYGSAGYSYGGYRDISWAGNWWGTDGEMNINESYYTYFSFTESSFNYLYSVRCIKD